MNPWVPLNPLVQEVSIASEQLPSLVCIWCSSHFKTQVLLAQIGPKGPVQSMSSKQLKSEARYKLFGPGLDKTRIESTHRYLQRPCYKYIIKMRRKKTIQGWTFLHPDDCKTSIKAVQCRHIPSRYSLSKSLRHFLVKNWIRSQYLCRVINCGSSTV